MGGWVHLDDIPGGLVVFCTLCGRKATRRTYLAENTNYAEARRLATAYHWGHEHSEAHSAALAAYHADPAPEVTKEQRLLAEIFQNDPPDERERRRDAARSAARTILRRG